MTTLSERIAARNPAPPPEPISNRRPVWIQRMLDQGLPVQDRTAYVLGSWVPAGKGDAA